MPRTYCRETPPKMPLHVNIMCGNRQSRNLTTHLKAILLRSYHISDGSCGCSPGSWTSRRRQSCGRRPGRAAARADRTARRNPATARGCDCDGDDGGKSSRNALSPSRNTRSGRRGRGCASGRTPWWSGKDATKNGNDIFEMYYSDSLSFSRISLVCGTSCLYSI